MSGHIDILVHVHIRVSMVVVASIVIVAVSVIVNDHHPASVVTAVTHCHSHFHSHHSAHRCTSHHTTGHTHSSTSVSPSVITSIVASIVSTSIAPIVVWIAIVAAIVGGRTRSHNYCLWLLFYYYSLSRWDGLLHNHSLWLWLHARVHLLLDRVAILIYLLLVHDGLTVWWLQHLLIVLIPLRRLRIY